MRYRLAILCLAAVLGVLPGLNTAPAVPLPAKLKRPDIYALVYVGLGKNDPDNAKRIAAALHDLPLCGQSALSDKDVNDLTIVQDKKRELGLDGWCDWAKSKARAANPEGTAVVRVWFADGSPEEQAVLANAVARSYVEKEQERFRRTGGLKALEREKMFYIRNVVKRALNKEEERTFRRQEEAVKHLPHVIEWASILEKP